MNKYILLLLVITLSLQSFTSPKKDLKMRVEALMELSISLTDNAKEEIEKIKTFLEPSEDRDRTAIALYQTWHQELKVFGKQKKKVQKIVFLNKTNMAFVDIAIEREVPRKNAKKAGTTDKQFFTMKATWKKVDEQWVQRTEIYAK